jgi:hypothetical protein
MNQFNNTKYTRWYYSIIQKRAILDKDARGEIHHIIPRSMGGDDSPENLVKLTGHDHAWCHWLLTKMTTGSAKVSMIYAFNMMGVSGEHMERQSSYAIVRAYEKNRIEWSKNHSDTMKGREPWNKGLDMKDDPRCKGGVKNRGKKRDPKASEQAAAKHRGRKNTEETKSKMSMSQKGIPKPKSDEFRSQVSKTLTGKPKRKGHGESVAAANRGRKIINKNGIEKRAISDDLQSYLDDGWSLGRPWMKKQSA